MAVMAGPPWETTYVHPQHRLFKRRAAELLYFKRLYTTFKNTQDWTYTDNGRRKTQFAALSLDFIGRNAEDPIWNGADDFIAATYCGVDGDRLHAEVRLLNYYFYNLPYFLRRFSDGLEHTLLIFSVFTPCGRCMDCLQDFVHRLTSTFRNVRISFGYIKMYIEHDERGPGIDETPRALRNLERLKSLQRRYLNFEAISLTNVGTYQRKLCVF